MKNYCRVDCFFKNAKQACSFIRQVRVLSLLLPQVVVQMTTQIFEYYHLICHFAVPHTLTVKMFGTGGLSTKSHHRLLLQEVLTLKKIVKKRIFRALFY